MNKIHYLRHDREHTLCGKSIVAYRLNLTKDENEITCELCKEQTVWLHYPTNRN